jgi:TolA-binding protein
VTLPRPAAGRAPALAFPLALFLVLGLCACGGEKAGFERAMASFDEGRMPEAAEGLSRFLDRYPDGSYAPEALYQRGSISLLYLDDPGGAARDFRAVAKGFPDSARAFDARLKLAELYESRLQGGDQARAEYARLLADFPRRKEAGLVRFRLGELAYRELRFDEARGYFGQLAGGVGKGSGDGPGAEELTEKAAFRLAQSWSAEGRAEEAATAWKGFLERFPQSERTFDARLGLAESLEQGGKGEDALALLSSLREGAADPAQIDLRIAKLKELMSRRGAPEPRGREGESR